jgi:tetratricopeptide (TPR) repeat protein
MVNKIVAKSSAAVSLKSNLFSLYRRHKLAIISLIIIVLALSVYLNQQAFLNLWLTRDQQGAMLLEQGKPGKAALTFSDKKWVAYSFYADGNFEQAASIYAQFDDKGALFSQANALAHIGQYVKAVALYQSLLSIEPSHNAASDNLALMNSIIKKLKKNPAKKELSNEIAKNLKMSNTDKKPVGKTRVQSSKLWLAQVQQNPSKFLRKKFQQEHQDESK